MKAVYIRISTPDQKIERQLKSDESIIPYIDICSGVIPFEDRPEAKKLMLNKKITSIEVKEVSRLGRNLRDILQTIDYFTSKNVDIYIENQGLHTLVNGKINPTAQMIIAILGTISQMERDLLRERTKEGIAIAKAKGSYKGRKRNTTNKATLKLHYVKMVAIQSKLDKGESIKTIAESCKVSRPTIYDWISKGHIKKNIATI